MQLKFPGICLYDLGKCYCIFMPFIFTIKLILVHVIGNEAKPAYIKKCDSWKGDVFRNVMYNTFHIRWWYSLKFPWIGLHDLGECYCIFMPFIYNKIRFGTCHREYGKPAYNKECDYSKNLFNLSSVLNIFWTVYIRFLITITSSL